MNANASGPHLPQRDWTVASYQRRSAEARLLPDDRTWIADTDAVDHLIGYWDGDRRVAGCGYHAIAELAWQAGSAAALLPTVNNGIDSGGAIIKDWLVANPAMVPHVDARSYRVHIPSGDLADWPSDHRLVTAAFDLAEVFRPLVGELR